MQDFVAVINPPVPAGVEWPGLDMARTIAETVPWSRRCDRIPFPFLAQESAVTMRKFTTHAGHALALRHNGRLMSNVDTDMIIPKQFLKTLTREGLGRGLFFDWRMRADGRPDPECPLNRPEAKGVSILIAGENFGCGSSREHAPWALLDYGFACAIAPSFADIFRNNCHKNGFLPIELDAGVCDRMAELCGGDNRVFEIDLLARTVTMPDGQTCRFDIDPGVRDNLLSGRDDIDHSLGFADRIERFEQERSARQPWTRADGVDR